MADAIADPDSLVTIATFSRLEEGQIARGRLEAEEIEAFLAGEAMVEATWHLTGASGGIRLQVSRVDEERARAVLADEGAFEPAPELSVAEEEIPDSAASAAREKNVQRAYRGAIVGLVACPVFMHVFSLYQLIDYWYGDAPVSPRAKRRAVIAFLIDVAVLAVTAFLLIGVRTQRFR